MSTTEMKNADALNSIYLTCDESGDIIYNGFIANSEKMGNFIKPKECI